MYERIASDCLGAWLHQRRQNLTKSNKWHFSIYADSTEILGKNYYFDKSEFKALSPIVKSVAVLDGAKAKEVAGQIGQWKFIWCVYLEWETQKGPIFGSILLSAVRWKKPQKPNAVFM